MSEKYNIKEGSFRREGEILKLFYKGQTDNYLIKIETELNTGSNKEIPKKIFCGIKPSYLFLKDLSGFDNWNDILGIWWENGEFYKQELKYKKLSEEEEIKMKEIIKQILKEYKISI